MKEQDDFLPDGYVVPKSPSDYLTLKKDGTTRIRILTPAVAGWSIYDGQNKPFRTKEDKPFTQEQLEAVYATYKKDKKREKPAHFWAFIVYDVEDKRFKVAVITQKAVKDAIQECIKDKDYGQPYNYDLKITRKGSGLETEYTVLPAPKEPLPQEVSDTFEGLKYNLENLFDEDFKSVFE